MAGVSSQGTYFTFTGFSAHATSVTVSQGEGSRSGSGSGSGPGSGTQRQRVSAAWLGSNPNLPEPYFEIWQPDPANEGALNSEDGEDGGGPTKDVQISYIGQTMPAVGTKGQLSITGKLNFSFQATVVSSSVTAALDDIVRGEVSFRVK